VITPVCWFVRWFVRSFMTLVVISREVATGQIFMKFGTRAFSVCAECGGQSGGEKWRSKFTIIT